MIRRTVLAARRAGFGRVARRRRHAGHPRALAGTPAELRGAAPAGATRLPWNCVVTGRDLKRLRAGGAAAGTAVASRPDLAPARRRLLLRISSRTPRASCPGTSSARSRSPSAGVLAGTRITPNAMTLVSVAVGLAGAVFFLSPGAAAADRRRGPLPPPLDPRRLRRRARAPEVPGVALGRRARLLGRQRRAHGRFRRDGRRMEPRRRRQAWPLLFGLSAVAGTFASALFVYLRTMTRREGRPPLHLGRAAPRDRGHARRGCAVPPRLHLSRSDTVRSSARRTGSSPSRPSPRRPIS